ncbi:MAG TPA: class I SAM-dependent methyltransferase [Candidatus Polarisedimenticolia bacterium]|nr:class I SAM-dependent methyltransferase [Candidatus Polarisedimenticolia bacterium]
MIEPELERVEACPCGSRRLGERSRAFPLNGIRLGLRRCASCGRLLLDPRLEEQALPEAYGEEYYGAGTRKFVPAIERVVDAFRDGRAKLAERLLGGATKRGRVLDIGCGSGQFLARIIARGHEGHGTELSAATGARAARVPGLTLHVGLLHAESFPPGFFDLISIWHVLEHLPDPDHVLRLCHGWLRDGGALLVAVPNADSWQAKLFQGSWFHLDPPRHLYHFNRPSLEGALTRAGFRVERLRTLSWEQNLYGILQSALNALGFPRDEFYEVLKGNRSIFSSPRLPLEGILIALLAPAALLFTALEAAWGAGGTLECVARRTALLP